MMRVSKLAVVLATLVALPAWSQDYFGAIAYSRSTTAHGWAKDHPSRDAAQRAAVSICRKHADDCQTVVWFKNGCGALATGSSGYGWGWGEQQSIADNDAIKMCAKGSTNCSVKLRVCTTR